MTIKTKQEIALMTPSEKKEYNKQLNRDRVKKYRDAHKDTAEYKEKHKKDTYKYRENHPDIYNTLSKKHAKTYYNKNKTDTNNKELMNKIYASITSNDILNTLFKKLDDQLPEKRKRGRPKKLVLY